MRLRFTDTWVSGLDTVLLAGDLDDDRWFGFADAARRHDCSDEAFFGELVELCEASCERDVLERLIAGFGLPWAELAREDVDTQMRMLVTMPYAFSRELLEWSPADVRELRERWVAGGMDSFVDAIRWLARYRRSGLWDRKVGPLYG